MNQLRSRLVEVALDWERTFGNAPSITSTISELDAAVLVGFSIEEYSAHMQGKTAVQKGHDFVFGGLRYQVKANRPSGKKGSKVTLVSKAKNYDWDVLIWLLYDRNYQMQEAWLWDVATYREEFEKMKNLRPAHMRHGTRAK